jgi:hypothetical protein
MCISYDFLVILEGRNKRNDILKKNPLFRNLISTIRDDKLIKNSFYYIKISLNVYVQHSI